MNTARPLKLEGEADSDGAGAFLDLGQVFTLLVGIVIILGGDQMDGHFFAMRFVFDDRLEEFHQVPDLVEGPDVGISQGDLAGTLEVFAK